MRKKRLSFGYFIPSTPPGMRFCGIQGCIEANPKQMAVSSHSQPKSLSGQLTLAGYFCVILPSTTTYFIKNRKPLLKPSWLLTISYQPSTSKLCTDQ